MFKYNNKKYIHITILFPLDVCQEIQVYTPRITLWKKLERSPNMQISHNIKTSCYRQCFAEKSCSVFTYRLFAHMLPT